ncbi:malate synthase A [Yonghaparkia sp. Soil809]|uniref:malate synthase A n=1 Tax=Yonghaparkia sp. Soil809 TaxID=1736417 RepID=UPI0006F3C394|nr:malate synthase A [Yonghaparkia sp. Soil809]KRF33212.1 malate synthase [Yonghaparkia sp. Soil809]
MTTSTIADHQLTIAGPMRPRYDEILTPEALAFVAELHRRFAGTRHERLADRMRARYDLGNGRDLRFLPETADVREDDSWRVAGAGPGLEDRRIEITGPTDPKMTINALNSGANVWLADLEDATSPTWGNIVEGQLSLFDAIRERLEFTAPGVDGAPGKEYRVTAERTPTIVMRPRGWHLVEKHIEYTDRSGLRLAASASLVDFGLYAFHNAAELVARGRGPYFYLPKLENHREARLWNDVFTFTEQRLGLDHGTIRATVLIETFPAAFQMEEILFELRDHCAGLNAGRWDYVFSIIKNYRGRGQWFVLPDRDRILMTLPFMRAYTELLVKTCHKRGAHAIGGMSAFIPNRRDPEVTERALERVAADKRREAGDGFDGSWVAHPDLIPVARAEFDAVLGDRPNQLDRQRDDVHVTARDLLDVRSAGGEVTLAGVRANIAITIRYLDSWLRGIGAAAIDNLMEDAATAEISRSQLWQWIHQDHVTVEGETITRGLVEGMLAEVLASLPHAPGSRLAEAEELFRTVTLHEDFPTFLTVPGYTRYLVEPAEAAPASHEQQEARAA